LELQLWNVLFRTEASALTVVSPLRFSKRNMLHFLRGAVAAQRLAVAMEHERTYLLVRTSGKTTARSPVFVCRSKQVHT
jgi:acetylglutamate kinase